MLKKKWLTKILAICMSLITVASATACNPDNGSSGPKPTADNLAIEVYGGGYGTDWVYSIAREYTKKTGMEVAITVQVGAQGISNMITSFASGMAETDIYFTEGSIFGTVYEGKKKWNGIEYDTAFADITDVYNTQIDGDMLYKDKMNDSYEELYNIDGKYYCTSWAAGLMGIIVNMDVWTQAGFTSFPRTTDEMFEYAEVLKGKGIAPFIYALGDEYWTSIAPLFMAQYEGSEGIKKVYAGYDSDGNRYTSKLAGFKGYRETLRLYDEILKVENQYTHAASQDVDFTNMQGMFLLGMAAMCPNGDWIEKEMSANYRNANIEFMKTPIISALSDKLSFKDASDADLKLRELVDYVDANASGYEGKPSFATNDDVDIVRDSRSLEMSASSQVIGYIPAYSNQIQAAKDFLIYMASDEAMAIYRSATGGCDLPFKWTNQPPQSNYSSFRNSIIDIVGKSNILLSTVKEKFYTINALDGYFMNNSYGKYVRCFAALESTDYVSPDAYYLAEQKFFQQNIDSFKKTAKV